MLTNFGERLVWAGQRLQARLGPQLQNLAQELESEINALLPEGGATVRIHASHGFAVSALRDLLARESDLRVDFRYVGNINSPASLAHGGLRSGRCAPAARRTAVAQRGALARCAFDHRAPRHQLRHP